MDDSEDEETGPRQTISSSKSEISPSDPDETQSNDVVGEVKTTEEAADILTGE